MDPLVSAIIPCYNAAPWITDTIASVRRQTWSRCEVIVVDDGSTDGSGEILDRLADASVKVVHKPNGGPASALNRGLQSAQGDFVEFLDADDLLAPDKIAVQLTRLRGLPPGWIASGAWARFTKSPDEAIFVPEAVWRDLTPVDWMVTSWNGGGMMHGAAWLAPRGVVDAAGPWDESLTLTNDTEYFTRLLLASAGVAFCPDARTFYRSSIEGSVSSLKTRSASASAFRGLRLSNAALLAREDSPRVRQACAINVERLIQDVYPRFPDLIEQGEKQVAALGGCSLKPQGGALFRALSAVFGWKLAKRLQFARQRLAGRSQE